MIEIFIRFMLFAVIFFYLIASVCYVPFAYIINKLNNMLQLKIAHKIFFIFCKILNILSDRIFEFEGENLINPRENYLVISNHVNEYDFLVLSNLFNNSENLSNVKYVMKSEMRNYYGIFQILDLLNFLTIERDIKKDEKTIKNYCSRINKAKSAIHLVLFPEGTLITENTINKSKEFRKSKNLEPLDYVLSPRYKGFKVIAEGLKDSNIKKVLDITFTYPECVQPTLSSILFSNQKYKIKYTMNIHELNSIKDHNYFLDQCWKFKNEWIAKAVNFNNQWFVQENDNFKNAIEENEKLTEPKTCN
ncbi:acylglycerol-3-phosphate acyltransferase-like protein [Vairimorpha ceranae]|uniref:Acylglycerol-3-phosphate acyltransferase-like protein n=1 Tax=Vairimorpha ceranae TaxID=40302 RepID=A0A0F9WIP2_9MICR|nr:acylglycerol-3-phosphate acyltransferase-like protein [Vairimorpha ceranae]KAF5140168.1 hypothetical protein G9O61_00g017220 [Vairimorpha ceranae]KKO76430.1 acylglycerol-3-phosphate acyltransferase-like protein [Vairimorpha ceranae]